MKSSGLFRTIVFIDSTVVDYQHLISGIDSSAEVILLDPIQDGIQQITQILGERHSVQSVHLVSHGAAGLVQLGSSQLSLETLSQYQTQLQQWQAALTPDADILLYGCDVASGPLGMQFIDRLSQITGADVAASTDRTGAADLGGNWALEAATGAIETTLVFQPEVMQTYRSILPVLLTESFRGSDVTAGSNWLYGVRGSSAQPFLTARSTVAPSPGGLPGNPGTVDPVGSGALRLTNAAKNQASFVIYDTPIVATGGLSISFELSMYGGTPENSTGHGADGISFFLVRGTESPTQAGSFGGSLGYANRTTSSASESGIVGGYLGIGFDAYGNFSQANEGRVGGPGRRPDAIAVRGSRETNYKYLTGTASLTAAGGLDVAGSSGTRENSRRRVQIDLTSAGLLTVRIDLNDDGDFDDANEQAITNFNVTSAANNNEPLPETFKFGFAASTGGVTNIHEIRNLQVRTINPLVTLSASAATVAESGGTLTLTATLTEVTTQNVTVTLGYTGSAVRGTDYTAPTTITIPAGQLSASITLTSNSDFVVEGDETIVVDIVNVTNAGGLGTQQVSATILDEGTPGVIFTPVSGLTTTEAGGTATFTAVLTSQPTADVTLFFISSDPSEGTVTSSITFTPSNWSIPQTVTVTGADDADLDGNVDYTINATSSSGDASYNGLTLTPVTVTNIDNDLLPTVTLSVNSASIPETGGIATITATLSGPAIQPVTITLSYGGSATSGSDYSAATTITIPVGQTSGSVTLLASDDSADEVDETVVVEIASVTGAIEATLQQLTITITDDDPPSPSPDPTPAPDPTPIPDPTPSPEPAPTPDPTPVPDPTPAPDPTPSPEPAPTPDPTPTPDPAPIPEPTPTPDPTPGSNPISTPVPSPAPPGLPNLLPRALDALISSRSGQTIPVKGILAQDPDGTIVAYRFTTLPPVEQGTLYLGDPATGGVAVQIGQTLTASEIERLFFRASAAFAEARFQFIAIDNRGNVTPIPGTVLLTASRPAETPLLEDCLFQPGRTLRGNGQRNRLRGTLGSDRILGGAGHDVLRGGDRSDWLLGGGGNDRLFGGQCPDVLRGAQGHDRLRGGASHDRLIGNRGNDRLHGNSGNDQLAGGLQSDRLRGSAGDDWLQGNRGRDRLNGGSGDDILGGGRHRDRLHGKAGRDQLWGNQGRDRLNGGAGNDRLHGGLGDDRLLGRQGQDTLWGGAGNDVLRGGGRRDRSVDILFGQKGDDVLVGGWGADRLSGGSGRDRFVYRHIRERGDQILDFEITQDRIDLREIRQQMGFRNPSWTDLVRRVQQGSDTVIWLNRSNRASAGSVPLATLVDVTAAQLTANHFLL